MKIMKSIFAIFSVLTVSIGLFGLAGPSAQAAYPEKPITLIVPFDAGGGFDALARPIASRLEKELGVPVPVKNEPGAGGTRGSITIFKSPPDGYTIGMPHFGALQVNEVLLAKEVGIDYRKFAVIMQISQSTDFVYVNKKSPVMVLDDFKKAGRTLKFGTTGVGALTWVAGNALASMMGFDVTFVTGYKSLGEAALGVARGDTDAAIGTYTHFQGVIDDIRPVACLSAVRNNRLPDVPTIAEAGFAELKDLGTPRIFAAPPGTPEAFLKVIRTALVKILAQEDFKKWALEADYDLIPLDPEGVRKALETNEKIYKSMKSKLQTN